MTSSNHVTQFVTIYNIRLQLPDSALFQFIWNSRKQIWKFPKTGYSSNFVVYFSPCTAKTRHGPGLTRQPTLGPSNENFLCHSKPPQKKYKKKSTPKKIHQKKFQKKSLKNFPPKKVEKNPPKIHRKKSKKSAQK